jgi:hypothetical protein
VVGKRRIDPFFQDQGDLELFLDVADEYFHLFPFRAGLIME